MYLTLGCCANSYSTEISDLPSPWGRSLQFYSHGGLFSGVYSHCRLYPQFIVVSNRSSFWGFLIVYSRNGLSSVVYGYCGLSMSLTCVGRFIVVVDSFAVVYSHSGFFTQFIVVADFPSPRRCIGSFQSLRTFLHLFNVVHDCYSLQLCWTIHVVNMPGLVYIHDALVMSCPVYINGGLCSQFIVIVNFVRRLQ